MKLGKNKIQVVVISILLFIIHYITQIHLDLSKLSLNGYSDGLFYIKIANIGFDFDSYTDSIPFHHFQRFFFPLVIGSIANNVNLNSTDLYHLLALLLTLIILINVGLISLEFSEKKQVAFAALILASFTFQFKMLIQGWVLLPDIIFILAMQFFCKNIWIGKNSFLPVIVASLARQTSLLIIPVLILKYSKDRTLAPIKSIGLIVVINLLTYLFSKYYINNDSELFDNISGFLRGDIDLNKYLLMFIAIIYCYIPVIFLLNSKRHFLLLFMLASFVIQPLLGGPNIVGYNNAFRTAGYLYIPFLPILLSGLRIRVIDLCFILFLMMFCLFDYKYSNIHNLSKANYFIITGMTMLIVSYILKVRYEGTSAISRSMGR
jgi:hypothetical protein